jgi:lipopolysaccharide transport system permease protein
MEYEIRPESKFNFGVKEILRYGELLYFFTWRDIKIKYKQTVLGFLWAILQPLLLMLVLTLFFGKGTTGEVPYPVFAFSGLILWNIFSSGLTAASNSMVTNANIIKKVYFPRLIIPVSSVLVALFDFLMTIPLLIALLLYFHVNPSWQNSWMLPLGLLQAVIATLGPGCMLAALNVKYRDFRYIVPFLIQVLLFVTPGIFPAHFIEKRWMQELFALNPVSGAITLFHGFITGETPDLTLCLISTASMLFFLFAGIIVFRKTESYFADLA